MQQGSMGWRSAPSSTKPQRFGHNTIVARGLSENAMTFAVRGEDTGSQGSATFGATVTKVRNGNITYHPLNSQETKERLPAPEYALEMNTTLVLVYGLTFGIQTKYILKPSTMNTISNPQMASFLSLLVNHPMNLVHLALVNPVATKRPGFGEDDELKAGCSTVALSDYMWIGLLGLLGLARRRN